MDNQPAKRPVGSHNLTHKYLDLILNLWELRQILCKTEFPPLFLGGGGGGEIRKTFLYQKNMLFA
ncbi:hypothetical protein ACE5IU_08230, partial [Leptospira kirschneri]